MRTDYTIEEMLLQSANVVAYRARGRNGFRYSVVRLIFPQAVLESLKGDRFKACLEELKKLKHPNLRSVVDGGLDKIDGMPWVARVWWDGDILEDRLHDGGFVRADGDRLLEQGRALIASLADRAGAISFKARDVILTVGRGGEPVETFKVDLYRWFLDWAMGLPPGGNNIPDADLQKLCEAAMSDEVEAQFNPQQEPVVYRPVEVELPEAPADEPVPISDRKLLFQEPRWGRLRLH